MNSKQLVCDARRIELFLRQQLTGQEQADFETHLDDCDECRQRLEESAASVDVWDSIRESLREEKTLPDTGDGIGGLMDSASDEDRTAFTVDHVRQLLAPTDDERMMGRLGGYEVVGIIGTGGMGIVVKALDPALNRYVAIKILAPHLGHSGAARKRFLREAQAAAAVVHDNVMEIHGVADASGLPYLVMPYVRGPSLQKRLDDDGPLSVVEVLRIARQAAAGLAAAHAQGLVHRDVKPANILLADGIERVKLTDFGLARAADDASLTKTGVIAGTPQFMSPEQARGEPVDPRSDLFGLGSVMYAMCTGRAPFRAETSYGILRRVTDTEPRPIRAINPDIPDWLCAIIAKLMSKQPEDRFRSASDVAELLGACLAHVQQPTSVPMPWSKLPACQPTAPAMALSRGARQRPWSSPRWLIGLTAFVCTLIVAGVLIVLELDKGTLSIESDAENVPIKIMQGDKIVEKLTVTREGNSVRVAAGQYVVEIDGVQDTLTVDNGTVTVTRGKTQIARIIRKPKSPDRSVNSGLNLNLPLAETIVYLERKLLEDKAKLESYNNVYGAAHPKILELQAVIANAEDTLREYRSHAYEVLPELQGDWDFVSFELAGKKEQYYSAPVYLSIQVDRWFIRHGGERDTDTRGSILIDASTTPRTITLLTDGPAFLWQPSGVHHQPRRGIYEVNGDTLRLCLYQVGSEKTPPGEPDLQPTEFKSDERRGWSTYTLKRRTKKAKPESEVRSEPPAAATNAIGKPTESVGRPYDVFDLRSDDKPPSVKGVVTGVGEKDLIEISMGADDGLQKGHTLEVYRDGTYLGRVIVRETWPDRAVVQIIPDFRKGIIRKGDRVATKLD